MQVRHWQTPPWKRSIAAAQVTKGRISGLEVSPEFIWKNFWRRDGSFLPSIGAMERLFWLVAKEVWMRGQVMWRSSPKGMSHWDTLFLNFTIIPVKLLIAPVRRPVSCYKQCKCILTVHLSRSLFPLIYAQHQLMSSQHFTSIVHIK